MFNGQQLKPIIPSQSDRVHLGIGDLWYHCRSMVTREYEVVLVRGYEKEENTPFTYVNILSLTHGDHINIRTTDACIWTGTVWPMKAE